MKIVPTKEWRDALRTGLVAISLAGLLCGPALGAAVPPTQSPGASLQPHPVPGLISSCESKEYFTAHTTKCEVALIAALPPGPCKFSPYLNAHFATCVAMLKRR